MTDNEINNIQSPGSINTIGQTGGVNVVVNNNLKIPDPKISIKLLEKNIERDGKYFSSFLMDIETQVLIPNLYLQANAQSIESFEASAQRSGISMSGNSGKREGFAFVNLQQAYGKYSLNIVSHLPNNVTFTINID